MKIKTIKNKEITKLNKVVALTLTFITCFFLLFSGWAVFGFALVFLVLTKSSGVQFDIDNRKYRKFNSILFYTRGNWRDLKSNKCFVVLKKHGIKTTLGTMALAELESRGQFYELYLMNDNHLRRFFVDSSGSNKDISFVVDELSAALAIPVERYDPQRIS